MPLGVSISSPVKSLAMDVRKLRRISTANTESIKWLKATLRLDWNKSGSKAISSSKVKQFHRASIITKISHTVRTRSCYLIIGNLKLPHDTLKLRHFFKPLVPTFVFYFSSYGIKLFGSRLTWFSFLRLLLILCEAVLANPLLSYSFPSWCSSLSSWIIVRLGWASDPRC